MSFKHNHAWYKPLIFYTIVLVSLLLILTCHVSVSNSLKYYLRKPFSFKSCDFPWPSSPFGYRLLCTRMYLKKKIKKNLALENVYCFISSTSDLNMRGGLTSSLKLRRSFGWSRNPALICYAERR